MGNRSCHGLQLAAHVGGAHAKKTDLAAASVLLQCMRGPWLQGVITAAAANVRADGCRTGSGAPHSDDDGGGAATTPRGTPPANKSPVDCVRAPVAACKVVLWRVAVAVDPCAKADASRTRLQMPGASRLKSIKAAKRKATAAPVRKGCHVIL
jgi:hypothetical protein